MAPADLIACSAPPVYVFLNFLKDSLHLPDASSCYRISCHNIILCLHWSLVQQALHVTAEEEYAMESSQRRVGASLLGPHLQSFLCQKFYPNTHGRH
jgi:hypothetical protein